MQDSFVNVVFRAFSSRSDGASNEEGSSTDEATATTFDSDDSSVSMLTTIEAEEEQEDLEPLDSSMSTTSSPSLSTSNVSSLSSSSFSSSCSSSALEGSDLSLHPSMVSSSLLSSSSDGNYQLSQSRNEIDSIQDEDTLEEETEEEELDQFNFNDNSDDQSVSNTITSTASSVSSTNSTNSKSVEADHHMHPSTTFFNVGSRLLSSNNTNSDCGVTDILDRDASLALTLALQAHKAENQAHITAATARNNSSCLPPTLPSSILEKGAKISLKQEYTCGLCKNIIVGACVLDCQSGESHAFCTPCMERYENPMIQLQERSVDKDDGNEWILLSTYDDPKSKNKKINKDVSRRPDSGNKNILSLLSKCIKQPQSNRDTFQKLCPVCHEPYTCYIPCRPLDIAISNFMQSKPNHIHTNIDDSNSISIQEEKKYLKRLKQWKTEVEYRRKQIQEETVQKMIQAQEVEIEMWSKRKDVWKEVLGTATTTLAMLALTLLVGGRSGGSRQV